MQLFYVLIILAIISVLFAFRSLKQLKKNDEIKGVKDVLKRGKVIFHDEKFSSDSSGTE